MRGVGTAGMGCGVDKGWFRVGCFWAAAEGGEEVHFGAAVVGGRLQV